MRGQTPEAEVDVVAEEDGQEEEGPGNRSERDPLSEEIVKQLEKGLPSWSGFGPEGWMGAATPVGNMVIYVGIIFTVCPRSVL
jgi:chromatin structure-remodeling complex subunit RSC1/2